MTAVEAVAKAQDILPEKILRQHVHEEELGAFYGVLAALVFGKANEMPAGIMKQLGL